MTTQGAMDVAQARYITQHPKFGDPLHVEAKHLLELLAEAQEIADDEEYLDCPCEVGELTDQDIRQWIQDMRGAW